ncbi:MAG: aminomethyl-transferring glycine dehydrogenase [Candidatus Competibacteraceae bacterium]
MSHPRRSLEELEQRNDFIGRHIGPDPTDQTAMLETLGVGSLAALAARVVPANILIDTPLALEEGRTEAVVLAELRRIAEQNQVFKSLIGLGYYNCLTPSVIRRTILENPAWYTAYTPYQPEISQGRLEALLNFQTLTTDLTGMELANASLLDEATAAAEAMALCHRVSKNRSSTFFVARDCFPQTIEVIQTRAQPLGIEVVVGDPFTELEGKEVFGVLLQYPGADGEIHDYSAVVAAVHAQKGLVAVAADLLSLTLLKPPGEFGVDVAVGSSQRFGIPLGFGGPHAAYMATRDAHKRSMPGRLVGVSIDRQGRKAYRLALQTREQHIRREKATSNICTAQVLLAVMAGMYAVYHGPQGLQMIAQRVHRLTTILAEGLRQLDWEVPTRACFDTLTVRTGPQTQAILEAARRRRINLRQVDTDTVGLSLDETTTRQDVETLWEIFGDSRGPMPSVAELDATAPEPIPAALQRNSPFLTHPVFHRYHCETEMLRYIRSLADKDIALDRAMIPLGSCTMKLNAATEMLPISWEQFSSIHPFAPAEQTRGYQHLIADLESWLCECTGYAAVTLQPNAGSQGEFTGLLIIQAYHRSRGEGHRNICLIPSSAHGTNPASAHMAGMEVVVVQCDRNGNVDITDLRAKAEQYSDRLAALMVTYPSTHGVFEEGITEICNIVHRHGGQVYIDGANLNALVGLCKPGRFGGDVSHLNLHKTFCIPHGGGGPGVGPTAVAAHLVPFLPGHCLLEQGRGERQIGAVAAAPWGSAGILPISWVYIALMGPEGLKRATQCAILNANYIAKRLSPYYPVLYTGPGGMVAHECIIDLRPLQESSGISAEDVAKRLIDYGFHAPTMAFPVAGTLMTEPTESESKAELERFCEAMIAIREEVRAVEQGVWDAQDNPLHNAPHTAAEVLADEWNHAYSREQAAYPVASLRERKYWPPVGRIDNVYGDRHLVCSCPPVADYEETA